MEMKMIMVVAVVGMLCLGGGYLIGNTMSDNTSTISIAGSSSVEPLMKTYTQAYGSYNDNIRFNLSVSDSTDGINKAMNGTVQIGMSSSTVTAAGAHVTQICWDAIAVIVSPALYNAGVTNLTPAQLKGIYEGTITNWNAVGSSTSIPITNNMVYTRESGSGTRSAFEGLIGATSSTVVAQNFPFVDGTGIMRTTVNGATYAIGYISLGSVNAATDKTVAINGVAPSGAAVSDGTYVLKRGFFLVTNTAPTGDIALFINWILSPAGQALLGTSYVPLYGPL